VVLVRGTKKTNNTIMKKNIRFTMQGHRADIGPFTVHRLLPNRYANAVGPFVFLDALGSYQGTADEPRQTNREWCASAPWHCNPDLLFSTEKKTL